MIRYYLNMFEVWKIYHLCVFSKNISKRFKIKLAIEYNLGVFVDDDIDRGDTYSRADLGDKSRAESIFDDS